MAGLEKIGTSLGTPQEFSSSDFGKTRKSSIRIATASVEIRNRHASALLSMGKSGAEEIHEVINWVKHNINI
jgi:hypothetical protein